MRIVLSSIGGFAESEGGEEEDEGEGVWGCIVRDGVVGCVGFWMGSWFEYRFLSNDRGGFVLHCGD